LYYESNLETVLDRFEYLSFIRNS